MTRTRSPGLPFLSLTLALAAAGLAACSDDAPIDPVPDAQPDGSPDGGSPDATDASSVSTSTVHGTSIDTYVNENGSVDWLRDFTDVAIEILVDDGAGGFQVLPGIGHGGGTFEVPDVPDGVTYLLHVDSTWIVTSARTIDLGEIIAGRFDTTEVTDPATTVSLDLSGMTPWQETDHLEMYTPNAATGAYDVDLSLAEPIAPGTTETSLTFDYLDAAYPPVLIEADRGDRSFITHLVTQPGQTNYRTLAEILHLDPFDLVDGGNTALGGALQPVAQELTGRLRFRRSLYDLLADEMVGDLIFAPVAAVSIAAQELPLSTGISELNLTLLDADTETETGDIDTDIVFGNPFEDWETFGVSFASYGRPYGLGGDIFITARAAIGSYLPLDTFLAGDNAPAIGPVGYVAIGGEDASGELSGVGATPRITWASPFLGYATGYTVSLVHAYIENGGGRTRSIASFYTTERALTVPPGLLEAGERYFLRITAFDEPGRDFAAAPMRDSIPSSFAAKLTALFTP